MTQIKQTFSGVGYQGNPQPHARIPMRASRCLAYGTGLSLLSLLVTAPSLARSLAVPCSAFSHNADGGWKVLAPVMLEIDGRLLGPMVGTTFKPGNMANGINMSEVLDRACR